MKSSPTVDQIAPAMLRAKSLISALPLVKDKRGDKAKYIELNTLNAAIEPILIQEGMMHLQGTTDRITDGVLVAITVETMLLHVASGQWFSNEVIIPVSGPLLKGGEHRGPVGAQDGGISLTYGRRYGIFAFWNLSIDEDTDGATKNQNRRKRARDLAEEVAAKTTERTVALRERIEAAKKPEPTLVTTEKCSVCGSLLGHAHKRGCPNGQPDIKAGATSRPEGKD